MWFSRRWMHGWVFSFLCLLLVACRDPALECEDPLGCVEIRPDEPLIIAALLDQSGRAAALSEDIANSLALALADRGHDLLGHPVEIVEWDGHCQVQNGAAAAREIAANTHVLGVIGTVCSESAVEAIPVFAAQGIVMISPADTAPRLTETPVPADTPRTYFRIVYNNRLQADIMAQFAYNVLEARTAIVVRDTTAYAIDLSTAFNQTFTELGGVVFAEGTISPGQVDVLEPLTAILHTVPDVVYLPLFEPEAMNFVVQIREQTTLTDLPLAGPDSLLRESFVRGTGSAADGMYLSGLSITGDGYADLLTKWTAQYATPPQGPFHAHAYDAINLLLDRVIAVAQIGSDGTLLIGRQNLLTAVAATHDYEALTGMLTCDAQGECAARTSLAVFQLIDRESPDSIWPPAVVWRPSP